jgi:hypothetical protein
MAAREQGYKGFAGDTLPRSRLHCSSVVASDINSPEKSPLTVLAYTSTDTVM